MLPPLYELLYLVGKSNEIVGFNFEENGLYILLDLMTLWHHLSVMHQIISIDPLAKISVRPVISGQHLAHRQRLQTPGIPPLQTRHANKRRLLRLLILQIIPRHPLLLALVIGI